MGVYDDWKTGFCFFNKNGLKGYLKNTVKNSLVSGLIIVDQRLL